MTLNHINILNKATLLAMLLLLSVGAMADGVLPKDAIKATVQQTVKNAQNTDEVKDLEAALLALYSKANNQITDRHSFTCQFDQDGNFYMTKDENTTTHVSELPMKYSSDMLIEFAMEDDQYTVINSKNNKRIASLTPAVSGNSFASIYSAFQININSINRNDVHVYAPTMDKDRKVLYLTKKTSEDQGGTEIKYTLPPATGVIFQLEENTTAVKAIELQYIATTTYNNNDKNAIDNNKLDGTLLIEPITDYLPANTLYTLDYQNGNTGFYRFVGDKGTETKPDGNTIPCRAFLKIAGSTSAKSIAFSFDDDPTGISDIQIDNKITEGPRYNLSGQRVANNAKGIIIVGGKKYINI